MGEPAAYVDQIVAAEQASQRRLTGQHDAHDQATIHFEVGHHAQEAEYIGPDVVAVVDEEHRADAAGVGGGDEVLLQATNQHRVGAGGHGTDRGGDLARP